MKLPFFLEEDNDVDPPYVLAANPHYYDYLHMLVFHEDKTIELVNGAGQLINGESRGRYRINNVRDTQVEIEFYDLIEVSPYQNSKKIRDLEPIRVRVTREKGFFPFRQEVVWKIKNEAEWPCLLFNARYIFDSDPLAFCRENQGRNLYYLTEQKDLINSTRYFYAREDRQELSLEEMVALGIPKETFW